MRDAESAYWDKMAIAGNGADNIWKRKEILCRLCKLDLVGRTILEIGIGQGAAFGALNMVLLRNIKYLGTDLSKIYVDKAKLLWGQGSINYQTEQSDILSIPSKDGIFDYCVCLDSLEHVRPEDREHGYREISRVLKQKWSAVVLNIPLEESLHENEFDHGFSDSDLFQLLSVCGMKLHTYDTYEVMCYKSLRKYAWAICQR